MFPVKLQIWDADLYFRHRSSPQEPSSSSDQRRAYDASLMLQPHVAPVCSVLDGFNVGRGYGLVEAEDWRSYHISTQAVEVWHILEFDYSRLPRQSIGQFHEGDTFLPLFHQLGRDRTQIR